MPESFTFPSDLQGEDHPFHPAKFLDPTLRVHPHPLHPDNRFIDPLFAGHPLFQATFHTSLLERQLSRNNGPGFKMENIPDDGPQLQQHVFKVYGKALARVPETPRLDLDSYIANYKERTRFDRLIHIGQTSVPLCAEALKAAVVEAKEGMDIGRYQMARDCLHVVAPSEPEAQNDVAWVIDREKVNKEHLYLLEKNLAGYKSSLIKDAIRMGHEELGRFHEMVGNLDKAVDAYNRMRPDVSTAKNIVDIGKHLIRVSVQRRDWNAALTGVSKLCLVDPRSEDDRALHSHADVVRGIANLGLGQYADAAAAFLRVDPASALVAQIWGEVATVNDVAVYGGVLAMATMERGQLQTSVLDNPGFRVFLETEPQVRKAVYMLVNGRYAACLQIFNSYRTDWMLDMHLSAHVTALYLMVRTKCIIEYVQPYSSIAFDSLDKTFGVDGEPVLEEVKNLIQSGMLNCRLDMMNRLLTNVTPKPRTKFQIETTANFTKQVKEAKARLYHMSVLAAGLECRPPTMPESAGMAFGRHTMADVGAGTSAGTSAKSAANQGTSSGANPSANPGPNLDSNTGPT